VLVLTNTSAVKLRGKDPMFPGGNFHLFTIESRSDETFLFIDVSRAAFIGTSHSNQTPDPMPMPRITQTKEKRLI